MADESRRTIVVAIEMTDEETYTCFRASIRPILAECGGCFEWDLRRGEVLTRPQGAVVNRVFAISFPSRERRVALFEDGTQTGYEAGPLRERMNPPGARAAPKRHRFPTRSVRRVTCSTVCCVG